MASVAFVLALAFYLNFSQVAPTLCGSRPHESERYVFSESDIFNGSIGDCGCSKTKICVRKCCDVDYVLVDDEYCVLNKSIDFKPDVYERDERINSDSLNFRFLSGTLDCHMYPLEPKENAEDTFYLQTDGQLWHPALGHFLAHDEYCLERFDGAGILALRCIPEVFREAKILNALGMIISMPFLLATFVVYALLPIRNFHGKALMCYVMALFLAYLLLVIIQIHTKEMNSGSCVIFALLCLFFFMVSFFWMNVMSIDMWCTFSGVRGFSGSSRDSERRRFLIYSCYAWGVPLVLVSIVAILSTTLDADAWYNPGIGGGQCWFRQGIPSLIYFYGPLAMIIVTNIILFARTALKIRRIQQDTALLRADENKKHSHENDKQRFYLYMKLLLAMGVNWSMEIISWLVDWQVQNVPPPVWILTDLCNALYGVFIFFIFVFKRSIWVLLKKRYYSMVGQVHLARTTTSSSEPSTDVTCLSMRKHESRLSKI